MLAFLRTFAAVVLAFAFIVFVPLVVLVAVATMGDTGPRDDSWLTIRLSGPLLEHYAPPTLRELFDDPPPCLMEITENLEKAIADDRIDGVILRLDPFSAGTGKLDEIRGGIRRVRDAGKPVYAHATSLSEAALYVASECDRVFLEPKGDAYLLGRAVTIQHLRGTLDLLDIEPQISSVGEYKSLAEVLTEREASPETLENMRWITEAIDESFLRVIEKNRGLDSSAVAALRERALLRAQDTVDEGLVDELLWWDELADRLRHPHDQLRTVSSEAYADVTRGSLGLAGRDRIAVVHAQGFVAGGGDDRWDTTWGLTLGPDRVVDDLEEVRRDSRVKAVILRWDTGGGVTDGGERIARAVERLRDEKPVVVSIADVAASAGYTMSFRANRIVCPKNGITGSIGSVTGKLNVRGLYEKLGITHDAVSYAPHALLYSELTSFTEEEWEIVEANHRRFYEEWISDIAGERDLTPEEVHESARGQVWTGGQARDRGLVDELGTFPVALRMARELADIDEDDDVELVHLPRERTVLDVLLSGELRSLAANEVSLAIRRSLTGAGPEGGWSLQWEPRRVR